MAPKQKATPTPPPKSKKVKADPLEPIVPQPGRSFHPAPTINLSTAEKLQLSPAQRERWSSDEGGKSAARRGPEYYQARLLGSCTLTFDVTGPYTPSVLGLVEKSVKPRHSDPRWGWRLTGKDALPAQPVEHWDAQGGEFSGQGFVSPRQLLAAQYDGTMVCDDDFVSEFLEAIDDLATVVPHLWGCPLIRAVIPPTAALLEAAAAGPKRKKVESKKEKAKKEKASLRAAAAEAAATKLRLSVGGGHF